MFTVSWYGQKHAHTHADTHTHKSYIFFKKYQIIYFIMIETSTKFKIFLLFFFIFLVSVIRCRDLYHSDGSPVNAYVKVSNENLYHILQFLKKKSFSHQMVLVHI